MRDIGRRIKRYRLGRYALPDDPVRRRLRWGWLAFVAWCVWAGFVSDHSLYRLWRLRHEQARAQAELEQLTLEIRRLESENRSPDLRMQRAERELREKSGMARPDEVIYRIRNADADSLDRD